MFRPKTYFNCHLQHLFGLLSTRRQRQNHAAPPSLTQEYKVNAPWWKPSGCHRENAFLYFFLQMLYFCFCLLVFCFCFYMANWPSPSPGFCRMVVVAKSRFSEQRLPLFAIYRMMARKYEENISLQLVPTIYFNLISGNMRKKHLFTAGSVFHLKAFGKKHHVTAAFSIITYCALFWTAKKGFGGLHFPLSILFISVINEM